ncbi:MAG: hypothetical protein MJY56_03335 [Bacteroidales bacterium]|nr:hypothetical protein [Bacteroidales bacterium]
MSGYCKFILSIIAGLCLLSSCDARLPGIQLTKDYYELDCQEQTFMISVENSSDTDEDGIFGLFSYEMKPVAEDSEIRISNDWIEVYVPHRKGHEALVTVKENKTSEDRIIKFWVKNPYHEDCCCILQHRQQ